MEDLALGPSTFVDGVFGAQLEAALLKAMLVEAVLSSLCQQRPSHWACF